MHANAPLSVEGRRRIERCRTRPIAHVATEMGVSRQRVQVGQPISPIWENRFARPVLGPGDHAEIILWIEQLRRERKWSARRIAVSGRPAVRVRRSRGRLWGFRDAASAAADPSVPTTTAADACWCRSASCLIPLPLRSRWSSRRVSECRTQHLARPSGSTLTFAAVGVRNTRGPRCLESAGHCARDRQCRRRPAARGFRRYPRTLSLRNAS